MKQQINLYQVEKQQQWFMTFTFQHMIWLLAAFLGTLLIETLVASIQHILVKRELTQLEKKQTGKSAALQNIIGQVPEERTREQLVNEIKKYETEKQEKQEILNLLSEKIDHGKFFSGYLDALSKETISGLWFTKVRFTENGDAVVLEGKSMKPEYVPNLIGGLSKDPAFDGKVFQVFKAALDDKTQQIDFVLQTKLVEKP
jgi:hypothetical protein